MKYFVLLLTFTATLSCTSPKYAVTKIEGKKIGITESQVGKSEIENYIKPYRDKIDADLNEVLAYSPENLDKSGEWQTNIGCFLADITFEKSNPIFEKRTSKKIDICLLNHGGIRTIIPKGPVTARNAYEVMPFENSAVVIGLPSEQITEIANYIVNEKKPHPLAGLTFTIAKDNTVKDLLVQGKPLEANRTYYVVTSDYLSNGGDNMTFFKKGTSRVDLDYKLRNIIIDYFKDVDTLRVNKTIRITKE
ncbi:5'-nucleotidase C-terminal domain-containing protein [Flavobacterium aciduliphilum]|uniref:5'-nucleotidase-like protein n=1 Tax=Flavobacterium aciduliphilum TaxID=1101402 RepID=A0A328YN15_9FLAO|nr:5'-nucleotidase [Flavobacterium aciduliphilum]RAR75451.1 5'-nucleotidase-like protein [Flavobacterium aciduliphilum]